MLSMGTPDMYGGDMGDMDAWAAPGWAPSYVIGYRGTLGPALVDAIVRKTCASWIAAPIRSCRSTLDACFFSVQSELGRQTRTGMPPGPGSRLACSMKNNGGRERMKDACPMPGVELVNFVSMTESNGISILKPQPEAWMNQASDFRLWQI